VGPLTLAGYVQPDGVFSLSGDPFEREDTFRIRRARFTLAGKVNDLIEWETSAELTASPVLRDAAVTFKAAPWAHLRAGQFVTPYSLERLTSTSRLELIDRVLDTFTPSRDVGFEVHSGQPIGGWLTYGAAIVNGKGQNQADDNAAKDVLGRLAFSLPRVSWVTVGLNAATGEQPSGRRDRYGADVHVRAGGFRFAGEFLREDREAAPDDNGFYLLAVHRWRSAELAGRVSRVRRGKERRRRVEAGANYYFTPRTRAMVSLVAEPDLPGTAVGIITRMQFGF
jgi:hypothetical protein